jgi:hypothetical protein
MTADLLPCPFCGQAATLYPRGRGYLAGCDNVDCEAEGPWDLGKSGAGAKWNTRGAAARVEESHDDTGH